MNKVLKYALIVGLMIALAFILAQYLLDQQERALDAITIVQEAIPTPTNDVSEKQGIDEPHKVNMPVCSTNTFKSYMDYRKITAKSTTQWRLQQSATTNELGLRMLNGRYLVAMSKTYGKAGDWIVLIINERIQIDAIIGDIKGGTNCTHPDGSMLEFIVDVNLLPDKVRTSGNVNHLFTGSITAIYKVEKEGQ